MRWWCSSADLAQPPERQFLGACVVEAPTIEAALGYAEIMGLRRGTETKITAIGEALDDLPFDLPIDVWIPRDEALALVDRIDRELGS